MKKIKVPDVRVHEHDFTEKEMHVVRGLHIGMTGDEGAAHVCRELGLDPDSTIQKYVDWITWAYQKWELYDDVKWLHPMVEFGTEMLRPLRWDVFELLRPLVGRHQRHTLELVREDVRQDVGDALIRLAASGYHWTPGVVAYALALYSGAGLRAGLPMVWRRIVPLVWAVERIQRIWDLFL